MKIVESVLRIVVVAFVFLVWIVMGLGLTRSAWATGPLVQGDTTTATASSSASATASPNASASSGSASSSNDQSNRSYGVGSGSPSANACQGVIFFGFSYDIMSCQLQQWAAILGANPTPMQMSIACQDSLLADLPFCAKYRKSAK